MRHAQSLKATTPNAARLIALYRERRGGPPSASEIRDESAGRGSARLQLSCLERQTRHLILSVAVPLRCRKRPPSLSSVDWRSLPRLMQEIGADALPVTSAANLLVGVIIGFLGVSQLGRFGAVVLCSRVGGGRALPRARTAGHRDRRGWAIGRWSRLGDRHDEGVGGNRRLAVHGV